MAHAIGSATLAFGLVSIPVKLHTTSQSSDSISFNMLHDACHSRLKQQYICTKDGEIVERSSMVKGYEVSKGQYVVFSEDELKAIEQKASEAIEIVSFVPGTTIDPLYFDKAYYLSPSKGGERAYSLLSAALRESGKWAVARYSARGKQYVVAIRPFGESALVLQQLYYKSAIKSLSELDLGTQEVKPQELQMALALTELGSSEAFTPDEFKDEGKDRMRALIEQKLAGQEITAPEEPRATGEVIDLMEALRASLAGIPKKKPAASSETKSEPAAVTKMSPKKSERKPAKPAPAAETVEKKKAAKR